MSAPLQPNYFIPCRVLLHYRIWGELFRAAGFYGPLAQYGRAPVLQSGGREFESHKVHLSPAGYLNDSFSNTLLGTLLSDGWREN